MGIGIRIFLIDEHDKLKRIPISRFERIKDRNPKELLLQFRNSRIRYAEIIMQLENRRSISILRISYGYLQVNSEGRVDQDFLEKEGQAIIGMMPSIPFPGEPENVIHASDRFAQKRFKDQFTWTPSFDLEQEIIRRSLE